MALGLLGGRDAEFSGLPVVRNAAASAEGD